METQKEIFLREKIYGLYEFALKTTITLSSSSLAFTTGLLSFTENDCYEYLVFLISGWLLLVISIFICLLVIKDGINIYYHFFKNINNKPVTNEFDGTETLENKIAFCTLLAFICFIIGILFLLCFIFININGTILTK